MDKTRYGNMPSAYCFVGNDNNKTFESTNLPAGHLGIVILLSTYYHGTQHPFQTENDGNCGQMYTGYMHCTPLRKQSNSSLILETNLYWAKRFKYSCLLALVTSMHSPPAFRGTI